LLFRGGQESSKAETPKYCYLASSASGEQMRQATERKRHQEGNETRAEQPGRTRYAWS